MSGPLPDATPFIGPIGRGKALLPAGADADQLAAVLRRALHTVECRELGPAAAKQQFGLFADTMEGRVIVSMDESELLARYPGHEELQRLTRAVRERGPAVDVVFVAPQRSILLMDEMAHVLGKNAESTSGAQLAGPSWLYELRRPLPVSLYRSAACRASDGR
ncbi:hypothetical protein [Streptomyces sp. NBC_00829]|uniref:hypothetical protein n=1 Tax=Streptomyces sp. NBC_00829 TaxID=2903679 RepID=UPI002F90DB9C|nr:hypothetical protein OG293_40445 [Streptomyces sp. NBC_00829]